jgi:sugar phosphate isomerase/epimerase
MFKNLDPTAIGVAGSQSELIEATLSHGFKGLNLDIVEFAAAVKLHGIAKARRYLDSARLKIGSYRLPAPLSGQEADYRAALDRLPEYLDLAEQLRCPRAVAAIEPVSQGRPYHEHFELLRRRLSEIAALLGKRQARLGLEFHAPARPPSDAEYPFIQSADAMLMLLKTIDAANIGLALDVWHWHLGGGTLEQLQAVGAEAIVTVSLADADPDAVAATAKLSERRAPGETGVIDSVGLLVFLAENGYDGPVTPLPAREIFAGQGREKIVRQVAASLDALWKAAGLNPTGALSVATGK